MKLSRLMGFVLALTAGTLAVTGCASGAGDQGSDEAHEGNVGTVALSLTGQANGKTYRLRHATFDVTGPTTTTLDSETDPNGTILAATLATGGYSITLQDGWSLERLDPMGAQTVSAQLGSPNPQSFMIGSGSTARVAFQFVTDGTIVNIGTGTLEVSIGVTDTSSANCDWLAQTGCAMGEACYFTGEGTVCANPFDTKPAGQPCTFQNECLAPGFCGASAADPMVGVCVAACAVDGMGPTCPAGQSCVQIVDPGNLGGCF